jgi:hypothetical protein
MEQERFAY